MNRLAVDIGGTFTDIVLELNGQYSTLKLLTTHQAPEEAVIAGATELLQQQQVRPDQLDLFVHGTTLATNAIIERKGARTALIVTEGFRDVLGIADEGRYNQYDIFLEKQPQLASRDMTFTVRQRHAVDGSELLPLDEAGVLALIDTLKALDVGSVAISLLHAYANPAHEQRIRALVQQHMPGVYISISSEVSPEIREYERTSTTVANAYVQPVMAGYLQRLREALDDLGCVCPLYLVTSSGALTTLDTAVRFPIRLVESGPAGGAILAGKLARESGIQRALSFDMGGTTAKICLIDDGRPRAARFAEVDRRDRFMKGSGLPLRIPVVELSEIGAGGGSIASIDNLNRVRVGPESAGSEPGPACYGRGGTYPTVSDANLHLGRLDPKRFARGRIPLDGTMARQAIDTHIGAPAQLGTDLGAHAILEMVDENMANAARMHAIEHGKHITDYTLISFGGGAPLHVARLAEKLGIARAVIPSNAGVGSAIGFLYAPVAFEVVRSHRMSVAGFDAVQANQLIDEMAAEAELVVGPAAFGKKLTRTVEVYMRYVGQGHEIVARLPGRALQSADESLLRDLFEREYEVLFSRVIPHAAVEILTWSVNVEVEHPLDLAEPQAAKPVKAQPVDRCRVFDAASGQTHETPVYWRPDLLPGSELSGPAIIAEHETTTYVTASFNARVDGFLNIVLDAK